MKFFRPEAIVRWLDELDAAAYAMRLIWAGSGSRSMARGLLLTACLAIGLALSALPGG